MLVPCPAQADARDGHLRLAAVIHILLSCLVPSSSAQVVRRPTSGRGIRAWGGVDPHTG